MIRDNFILDLNDEIFGDNFAGGGGASCGAELALGRHVDEAANHDEAALGMHRINHPQTVHHLQDIFEVDYQKIAGKRRWGGMWFSPDCKHFSKAKGGKPLDKKIRGLALVIFRAAKIRTRVIYMENVEEIQKWGPLYDTHSNGCEGGKKCKKSCHYDKAIPEHACRTWNAFINVLKNGIPKDHPDIPEILEVLGAGQQSNPVTKEDLVRGFGYDVQYRELRACDYGAPTIRKRLFLIARCDGLPIVWPKPTHAAPEVAKSLKLKPYRTIAECIDWTIPCKSIFLNKAQAKKLRCRRPLAKSSEHRIAKGTGRFVLNSADPFLISLTHQGGDRIEPIDEPVDTITAAHRGEKALVDATVAPFITEHANSSNQRNMPADEPMRTTCANVKGGHFAVCAAHITKFTTGSVGQDLRKPAPTIVAGSHSPETHGGAASTLGLIGATILKFRGNPKSHFPAKDIKKPLDTISSDGLHHGVCAAYLAQHNAGFNTTVGHDAREPISTISAKGSQQQIVSAHVAAVYGNKDDIGQTADSPSRTVTTKERFELVESTMANGLTPEQIIGARRVAKFLRKYGVEFEGEFATLTIQGHQWVIVDIGMRMLTARELFRAQGFPEDYVIDRAWVVDPKTGLIKEIKLTKEQQIRMCGNSVSPLNAKAIIECNSFDLSIWRLSEMRAMKRTKPKTTKAFAQRAAAAVQTA